jgi:hypothetical protein
VPKTVQPHQQPDLPKRSTQQDDRRIVEPNRQDTPKGDRSLSVSLNVQGSDRLEKIYREYEGYVQTVFFAFLRSESYHKRIEAKIDEAEENIPNQVLNDDEFIAVEALVLGERLEELSQQSGKWQTDTHWRGGFDQLRDAYIGFCSLVKGVQKDQSDESASCLTALMQAFIKTAHDLTPLDVSELHGDDFADIPLDKKTLAFGNAFMTEIESFYTTANVLRSNLIKRDHDLTAREQNTRRALALTSALIDACGFAGSMLKLAGTLAVVTGSLAKTFHYRQLTVNSGQVTTVNDTGMGLLLPDRMTKIYKKGKKYASQALKWIEKKINSEKLFLSTNDQLNCLLNSFLSVTDLVEQMKAVMRYLVHLYADQMKRLKDDRQAVIWGQALGKHVLHALMSGLYESRLFHQETDKLVEFMLYWIMCVPIQGANPKVTLKPHFLVSADELVKRPPVVCRLKGSDQVLSVVLHTLPSPVQMGHDYTRFRHQTKFTYPGTFKGSDRRAYPLGTRQVYSGEIKRLHQTVEVKTVEKVTISIGDQQSYAVKLTFLSSRVIQDWTQLTHDGFQW